jgi:hypothetical protein
VFPAEGGTTLIAGAAVAIAIGNRRRRRTLRVPRFT